MARTSRNKTKITFRVPFTLIQAVERFAFVGDKKGGSDTLNRLLRLLIESVIAGTAPEPPNPLEVCRGKRTEFISFYAHPDAAQVVENWVERQVEIWGKRNLQATMNWLLAWAVKLEPPAPIQGSKGAWEALNQAFKDEDLVPAAMAVAILTPRCSDAIARQALLLLDKAGMIELRRMYPSPTPGAPLVTIGGWQYDYIQMVARLPSIGIGVLKQKLYLGQGFAPVIRITRYSKVIAYLCAVQSIPVDVAQIDLRTVRGKAVGRRGVSDAIGAAVAQLIERKIEQVGIVSRDKSYYLLQLEPPSDHQKTSATEVKSKQRAAAKRPRTNKGEKVRVLR